MSKRKASGASSAAKVAKSSSTTNVFIGGLHESGGAILRELLRSHPSVACVGKPATKGEDAVLSGQDVQDVYGHETVYGGAGYFARSPAAHRTESAAHNGE